MMAVSYTHLDVYKRQVLHYAEGMSYAEIADALRLPQSTVRSRLHNAREQLRKELEAE